VEVYNISSYQKLVSLVSQFGEVHLVGKSFGTCKLTLDNMDIDFTLPRKENKIDKGHKGFEVEIDPFLSFKEAASRRDFTINAIGYDPIKKEFLDPFNGKKDIKNKLLKAIDPKKFIEDPLRVYRSVGFASRFDFSLDEQLFILCQTMINRGDLGELPKERVYEELKKMFLKSKKPSLGLTLLYNLQEKTFFSELLELEKEDFLTYIQSFDRFKQNNLILYFALLSLHVNIERFTNEKQLLQQVKNLLKNYKTLIELTKNNKYDSYELKLLATKVELDSLFDFTQALYPAYKKKLQKLYKEAKDLNILHSKIPPQITGKKLIELGFSPSESFHTVLENLYLLQLKNKLPKTDKALKEKIQ